MKLSWLLFVFITVVCGATSYKIKAHTGQTEVFAIVFGPGLHQTFKNSSSDERKFLTSKKVDDVNSILTDDFDKTGSHPKPPSPDDASKMARFIVHYSLWGSLSHISHQPNTSGAPLARVYSISDGPIRASSGVPYFYLTPNDPELRDMIKDPKASLTLTLAQTPYCRMNSYDPEDPRCAQVILTGRLVVLKNSTLEWNKAQQALFSRHPVMRKWPESHHWVCCKLEIDNILVADNFGGNKYPSVEDYFRAQPDFCSLEDPLYQMAFY